MIQSPKDDGVCDSATVLTRDTHTKSRGGNVPIAIIGIGCRFPGNANSPEAFWQRLTAGVDAVTDIPPDRIDLNALYDPKPGTPGKIIARQGGFLENLDQFDPYSLGISPREAAFIDPQQRLLMEVAWEAFDDAGIVQDRLAKTKTGVFIGMWTGDYEVCMYSASRDIDLYITTGGGRYSASGRLSYVFNLQGPSLTVDTACSSSLVAVHLACQSLRDGESELALAGGVNLILQPHISIGYSKSKMLSPDSRCKFGDAAANGYVRSEGAGVILLKPLPRAIADGDPIYALILGSAVNNDGQAGLFVAPSPQGQEAVLRQAYRSAGVAPCQVKYIEAHGTGTAVGDPVELQSLGAVLGEGRPENHPFMVGSVKTNIGHTEAASGVAGLIKTALVLKHRLVPPSLHLRKPNPNIPWEKLPLKIQQSLQAMPEGAEPAVAGVNSFGVTGTNAHVVLQEFRQTIDAKSKASGQDQPFLLPLSAPRSEALQAIGQTWGGFLGEREGTAECLQDICYTASVRRAHYDYRLAIVGANRIDFVERLAAYAHGEAAPGVWSGRRAEDGKSKLVFVFSGQGPQWHAMGRELLEQEAAYREAIERCDGLFRAHAVWSLLAELTADASRSRLNETEVAQPAIFALQMGLASLWRSWGIEPDAVVGHSIGEVAAACVAGAITLEQAVRLVFHRGRLLQRATGRGKMAAVGLSLEDAESLLMAYNGRLSIAAINSPTSLVLSGETEALQEILNALEQKGKFCRMLTVNYAFHSPQVEPYRDELVQVLEGLTRQETKIPIWSTVTGKVASGEDFSAPYWGRNMRQRVEFAAAIDGLIQEGHELFVELSPHPVLGVSLSECLRHRGAQANVFSSLRRGENERQTMLEALAALYVRGRPVGWQSLYPSGGRCIRLPAYPWQREHFWIEKPERDERKEQFTSLSPLKHDRRGLRLVGQHVRSSVHPGTHFCEMTLSANSAQSLKDHRIHDAVVLPAAVFLEMALRASKEAFGDASHVVENMVFKEALILREDESRALQLVLRSTMPGSLSCQFLSRPADARDESGSWTLHVEGEIQLAYPAEPAAHASPAEMEARLPEGMAGADFYRQMVERGFQYGPTFQSVEQVWLGEREAFGKLGMESSADGESGDDSIPPTVMDGCFQLLAAMASLGRENAQANGTYIPVSLDRLQVFRSCRSQSSLWAHAIHRPELQSAKDCFAGNVVLFDGEGSVIAEVNGMVLQRLERERSQEIAEWLHEIQWIPVKLSSEPLQRQGADYIPTTAQIGERALAATRQSQATFLPSRAKKILPQLDQLCTGYIAQALQRLGCEFRLGDRFTTSDLADRLGVTPQHRRMLGRLLEILQQEGFVGRSNSEWEVLGPLQFAEPQNRWKSLLAQYPDCDAELTLLGNCGEHLAEVLRGKCDPLQLLFPQGTLDTAGKLYQDAPFSRFCNSMIREVVSKALAKLPAGRKVRILEIGAGTGGTTAHVLPLLPADRTEYVFTDVSTLFTAKAEAKFSAYPFIEYRLLDIAKDAREQGYQSKDFDLILAANVLHATPNLRQTLGHVRELLAPGGLLVLLEGTSPQRWVDIIFGLTEGWWLFADPELRPSHPLVSRSRWPRLLQEVGFAEPVALPAADERQGSLFDQTVLLAREPQPETASHRKDDAASADTREQIQDERAERPWLVFADDGGLGDKLAEALRASGHRPIVVHAGVDYERVSDGHSKINPACPEHFERLIRDTLAAGERPYRGVVHAWALDAPLADEARRADLDKAQADVCGSALHLVQALANLERSESSRLWLVTRGAQQLECAPGPVSVLQAPLWGLGRVIALEHPNVRCSLVDLDSADGANNVTPLCDEILADEPAEQVAFRGRERYAARLVRSTPARGTEDAKILVPESRPYQLQIPTRGVIDNLTLKPALRSRPRPGEIEIRIQATGLNFRDLWVVLGMNPKDSGVLGLECAGTIVALGEGVHEYQVGDEVIAFAQGTFSSFTTVSTARVARRPKHVSVEEAAAIPVAFLTAEYSLRRLAQIKRGDRVLIHAASGGVGMVALQIAQNAGAEIFATAGNPEKRELLRSLGVQHIMDSRSLGFAEEVMEATRGQGVDIVLNSLAGEFIPKSLSVLGENGRFVEIGKTGVWTESQVKQFKNNCSYYLFDLIETAENDPLCIQQMLQNVVDQFDEGILKPLPLRSFSIEDSISAFRLMSEAKHVGKIVITPNKLPTPQVKKSRELFRADGTYLITGGFGGLGLLIARWMVEHGARCLALVGHRGVSQRATGIVAELEGMGARVLALQGDVSSETDVNSVLTEIRRAMPPLRGVFHCAGALDDGVLLRQNWTRFEKVMAPKIGGAWNLHRLTGSEPLDFFVLFSTWASVLGSPGQGNHAAANAFMDALAHHRRAIGRPALSINWGPWSEVGAAAQADRGERLGLQGIGSFNPAEGLKALQLLLEGNATQVAVVPFDANRWCEAHPAVARSILFDGWKGKRNAEPEKNKDLKKEGDIRQALKAASRGSQRRALLESHIRQQVAQVLRLSPSRMDAQRPFKALGLDSLTALEMCNRLETSLGVTLPATLVWNYPTIAVLAPHLASMLEISLDDTSEKPAETSSSGARENEEVERILNDLEHTSEEELLRLLTRGT